MKEILVYADWEYLLRTYFIGILRSEISRGKEIFSFEYSSEWLESGLAQTIDPDLKLYAGPQFMEGDKVNFGIFLDSSPDRWGRMLMNRREAMKGRESGKTVELLYESDYLLGVFDETRMGGLRFKLSQKGHFLEYDELIKVPPVSRIRELEQASLRMEKDDFFLEEQAREWLDIILAPGSSLGGARPKANVLNTDGTLWIAKFPSRNDNKDSGAWEFLVNQLAKNLGLNVAKANASIFSQKKHTYMTKRFDRSQGGERIHFASALTLLGYKDGYSHKEGGSYLELVELIEQYAVNPNEDLIELWKRITFYVAISNTDDHLRNHGFLLSEHGWSLSPAFDINPDEYGTGLSLNISEFENTLDFDLCLSVAEYFRWNVKEARSFINKTKRAVSKWPAIASELNISKIEKERMERAFHN